MLIFWVETPVIYNSNRFTILYRYLFLLQFCADETQIFLSHVAFKLFASICGYIICCLSLWWHSAEPWSWPESVKQWITATLTTISSECYKFIWMIHWIFLLSMKLCWYHLTPLSSFWRWHLITLSERLIKYTHRSNRNIILNVWNPRGNTV